MDKIMYIILSIMDVFFKGVKRKKGRIQFLTNESTEPEGNFKLIKEELERRGHEDIHFYGVKFKGTTADKIHYIWVCIRQLYLGHKAELVILNDNNYMVSRKKPEGLKVMQIWHACGAIKKFGNQINNRRYKIGGYDRVICCGEYWRKIYSEAFNAREEDIIVTGMPCTDELVNEEREGDRTIAYIPTFRGNSIDGIQNICLNTERLERGLPAGWEIKVRNHPLVNKGRYEETLNDMLLESSIIITDYSSILLDASLLKGRTIIIYAPDYQKYGKNIGYNIDLPHEFERYFSETEDYLAKIIGRVIINKENNSASIQKKYIKHRDGRSLGRVCDEIEALLEREQ